MSLHPGLQHNSAQPGFLASGIQAPPPQFYKRNYLKRGCTPAMAAGVTDTFWTVRDLVEMVEG